MRRFVLSVVVLLHGVGGGARRLTGRIDDGKLTATTRSQYCNYDWSLTLSRCGVAACCAPKTRMLEARVRLITRAGRRFGRPPARPQHGNRTWRLAARRSLPAAD
jgi:hypothetical protein